MAFGIQNCCFCTSRLFDNIGKTCQKLSNKMCIFYTFSYIIYIIGLIFIILSVNNNRNGNSSDDNKYIIGYSVCIIIGSLGILESFGVFSKIQNTGDNDNDNDNGEAIPVAHKFENEKLPIGRIVTV